MLVRKLRLQRGWSQEHLAELVGVSTRTIQRIERGFKPCFETSKALATIFEIDIALLTAESTSVDSKPVDIDAAKKADEETVARLYMQGVKEFYNHLITYLSVAIIYGFLTIFHSMGDQEIIFFGLAFWGFCALIHGLAAFEKINFMGIGTRWEEQVIAKRLKRKQSS